MLPGYAVGSADLLSTNWEKLNFIIMCAGQLTAVLICTVGLTEHAKRQPF